MATPLSNVIKIDEFRNKFRTSPSVWNWKELAKKEIDNSDKLEEGDLVISQLVKENAKLFVDKLPIYIKAPAIGTEQNGTILFEWISKKANDDIAIFSAIIDEERIVYSTFNLGDGSRGVTNITELSIETLSTILMKYFENHALRSERYRHSN